MTVFIVYTEWNKNEEPEILHVTATQELADTLRAKAVKQYERRGLAVFGEHSEDEWDVDIHVDEHEVKS